MVVIVVSMGVVSRFCDPSTPWVNVIMAIVLLVLNGVYVFYVWTNYLIYVEKREKLGR